ncbi:MAG: response regulator [Lachnospiraceae bacterium]|nr:response regulator [Lachnospiraceae bacterium]MBP5413809.1 response regulator [Lachnospiraceae bacterium]MBP5745256.1 response regulator [Lachnospiraceae bacterium]
MTLKVLITGKNRKVAGDISERLEKDRGYFIVKCGPTKNAIFDIILAELPKVVIICLGDETADTVKAYDVLRDATKRGLCIAIVIANDEDEKIFMKYSELSRVFFLSRPVSLFALYEKMTEIEEKLEKKMNEEMGAFKEFVNEEAEQRHRRKQILVVDDDTEQLIHIKEQLEEFYDVTPVKSGEAAFKFLEKKKPDLILLDYLMPNKDGPMVLKELRTMEGCESIPVIFLTGMSEKHIVIQTLTELMPQGYVVKPAKKSELVAKIIDVLG